MITTLADLLTAESTGAKTQLTVLCRELGVRLFPDHEGALLRGAFVERRPVPRSQYLELARSWEQFDRAFAPAKAEERALALDQLERFVKWTGVAGDLGDHILFVIERHAAPDILVSLGDDAWDDWLAEIGLTRELGPRAAEALRELLLQDPHLHGQAPEQDH